MSLGSESEGKRRSQEEMMGGLFAGRELMETVSKEAVRGRGG